ncbi:MAG: HlyD family secretion protein [Myxococcota bacterium]|nr:HlyD family secretion protein [Myxococcales bacterium]
MTPARRFALSLRGGKPGTWISIVALVVAIAAGAFEYHRRSGFERTDDAFVEGTLGRLAPEVSGRIVEILVDEHEAVAAGDVLVRLDRADFVARLDRARADLDAARNRIEASQASAASSEAGAKAARVEVWRAGRELARVEQLVRSAAASAQQLDAARAANDAAVARVRALELQAKAEREVVANEAPLRQAEAALREAELALARTEVRAPFDGVVGRKSAHEGDIVREGQPLMALRRSEASWIVANFKETQLRRMRVGAPADVRVDAFPAFTWHGHVESFSPASGAKYALIPPEPASGNFTKVVQRVPVKIVLDEVENDEGRAPVASATDAPVLALGLSAEVAVDVR